MFPIFALSLVLKLRVFETMKKGLFSVRVARKTAQCNQAGAY